MTYHRLRSIGVSVETADAIAPVIDALPEKKQTAFMVWLCTGDYKATGMPKSSFYRLLDELLGKNRSLGYLYI